MLLKQAVTVSACWLRLTEVEYFFSLSLTLPVSSSSARTVPRQRGEGGDPTRAQEVVGGRLGLCHQTETGLQLYTLSLSLPSLLHALSPSYIYMYVSYVMYYIGVSSRPVSFRILLCHANIILIKVRALPLSPIAMRLFFPSCSVDSRRICPPGLLSPQCLPSLSTWISAALFSFAAHAYMPSLSSDVLFRVHLASFICCSLPIFFVLLPFAVSHQSVLYICIHVCICTYSTCMCGQV